MAAAAAAAASPWLPLTSGMTGTYVVVHVTACATALSALIGTSPHSHGAVYLLESFALKHS
jgi:hypothetical protein